MKQTLGIPLGFKSWSKGAQFPSILTLVKDREIYPMPAELRKIFFSAEVKRKPGEEKAKGDLTNMY